MQTVGIIGFGSFGKFLAEKISSHAKVYVYSARGVASSWTTNLEQVAQCDYVILAIPLNSYKDVLGRLKPLLGANTVLVDVCSVKEKPLQAIRHMLPHQPVVATHPMFGPESASLSLKGHAIVMCPESSTSEPYATVLHFVQSLGLEVVEMGAHAHDKEIAVVQGLTFFVAHTLETMNIRQQKLHTPSFGRLLNLAELERHHSQQLFETIQQGNNYTKAVRERFLSVAMQLDQSLTTGAYD